MTDPFSGPKIIWQRRRYPRWGAWNWRPAWEQYRRPDGSMGYRAKRWWPAWEPIDRVLDDELLGSLHEERVRCGKRSCRCASRRPDDAHVAFYRRWIDEDTGIQRKAYVKKTEVAEVRAAIERRRQRLAVERDERDEYMGRGPYSWKALNRPAGAAPGA